MMHAYHLFATHQKDINHIMQWDGIVLREEKILSGEDYQSVKSMIAEDMGVAETGKKIVINSLTYLGERNG